MSSDEQRAPKFQADGHSGENLPLHGSVAPLQRLTEGAFQQNPSHPPHVSDVRGDIETHDNAQPILLLVADGGELILGHDEIDDVAWKRTHHKEHQHAQDEQRGDEQQQPADGVGTHGRTHES